MRRVLSLFIALAAVFMLVGCALAEPPASPAPSASVKEPDFIPPSPSADIKAPAESEAEYAPPEEAEDTPPADTVAPSGGAEKEGPLFEEEDEPSPPADKAQKIDEYGTYTSKEDVALYIHTYGRLPGNFITKKQAEKLGWSGGSLEPYAPGKCIGGSRFGNYEGALPDKKGRTYTECDIDTLGKSKRGAKRIVFSNDGLIYYTEDHYASFEFLYGGDD